MAELGPCRGQLQQHGVQRLDGPHLRPYSSKRIGQRASDLTHLDFGLRQLYAAERHVYGLLLGRHVVLAATKAVGGTRRGRRPGLPFRPHM
eukprot:scaffold24708_cov67-Phaeocystis_antarctica.AAC.2